MYGVNTNSTSLHLHLHMAIATSLNIHWSPKDPFNEPRPPQQEQKYCHQANLKYHSDLSESDGSELVLRIAPPLEERLASEIFVLRSFLGGRGAFGNPCL